MKKFLSKIFKRKTDIGENVGDVGENVVESDEMVSIIGREFYKHRKSVIDRWMDEYLKRYLTKELEEVRVKNKMIEQYNNVCPKCGKTFIVSRFIKNSDEVFAYNHCNDCTHEWVFKNLISEKIDPMEHTWYVVCLLDSLSFLVNQEYNSSNRFLYDSYEDMVKQKLDEIRQRYQEMIDTFPMEVLYYLGYKWTNAYMTGTKEVFNTDYVTYENGEQYTGEFTPQIKEYLGRLGVRTLSHWNYE